MKNNTLKVFGILIFLFAMVVSDNVLAGEKIGNLVFNSMRKIQETHKEFLGDVKTIKDERKAAIAERETVKKQYKKAKEGTLDKREFHARFSYSQAKVYRALYDEARLTHQVTRKQLRILTRLNESVTSGEAEMSAKAAQSVVDTARPFLENGKALLISMAQYRHKIADPIINSKLNAAYDTARMLSNYVKHIEKGKMGRGASQLVLKQKMAELIEQLNALYVQTDIFMAMIRDKTIVLKMINELAAAEAAIWAVSDGKKVIAQLSTDVMSPLMDTLNESDEDLNSLVYDILDGNQGTETSVSSQRWSNPNL